MLKLSTQSEPVRAAEAALAQVGWIGQTGATYGLDDPPGDGREPGGYQPLYIQIGVFVSDAQGRTHIED